MMHILLATYRCTIMDCCKQCVQAEATYLNFDVYLSRDISKKVTLGNSHTKNDHYKETLTLIFANNETVRQ